MNDKYACLNAAAKVMPSSFREVTATQTSGVVLWEKGVNIVV